MPTFAELYCARNKCPLPEFHQQIFWRTLHRHAVPVAPLLLMTDYFSSDHTLIEACGRATQMREVYDSTQDFAHHPKGRNWLHRHAKLRISAQRICRLAGAIFPNPGFRGSGQGDPARKIDPSAPAAPKPTA